LEILLSQGSHKVASFLLAQEPLPFVIRLGELHFYTFVFFVEVNAVTRSYSA